MKTILMVAGVAAMALAAGSAGTAKAQTSTSGSDKVIYTSAENASYKEMMPGVSIAVVWGDPASGAHGTFTKFKPGYDAGMHTHSSDIIAVVIKGAYLYKDEAGEKRVGPGEFIRIPAGHKHWSGGDKVEGVLMYQEGTGKFDLIPAT